MKRLLAAILVLIMTFSCATALAATSRETKALQKALSYLRFTSFSFEGLVEQLEYEGYSKREATYGATYCGADWNEQAYKKAQSYMSFTAMSHERLIDQLEYEGFTTAQATYGANMAYYGNAYGSSYSSSYSSYGGSKYNTTTTGKTQALKKAKSYLSFTAFSYTGLIEQLEYEGFTKTEATYAADNCGANWNEQAAKKAKSYLKIKKFTRSELIRQLQYEGFTSSQASYGVRANGY